jgi:hypothetical protein
MMAKKSGKTDGREGGFISERVKDLAVMYLTRRKDLEVRWEENSEEWIDCMVEITGKNAPSRRLFGVELRGTMSPVTDDHANKRLRTSMQAMLRRVEFPFPVCLLYFTMQNNEGRYTWIAEPVFKDGQPVLTYHGEADVKKFDKEALDSIIDKINLWFDAMRADEGNVSCGACGTVLYGESSGLSPSDRKPCPRCGSTKRAFSVQALMSFEVGGSMAVQAEVITYEQTLLNTARDLMKQGLYNPAIVLANQASEIATERAIARALAVKKQQRPEEIAKTPLSGYNLANEQTRAIYTDLTGDDIRDQPFWRQFKEFVELRNQIVHNNRDASKSDAQAALDAASRVVSHLRGSIAF